VSGFDRRGPLRPDNSLAEAARSPAGRLLLDALLSGEANEDAFMISGTAEFEADPQRQVAVSEQFLAERSGVLAEGDIAGHQLFSFRLDRALLTRTERHGDPHPRHTVWRAE
jgi:hypothetical protein